MASRSNKGPHTEDDLFTGLKFWLSRQVPMRPHFEESMRRRGATLVANEFHADMRIVDDARKNLPVGQNYYSYKFIAESIKNNRLEDHDKYSVGLKSAADRPVGSMIVAAKRARRPFSKADDQILYNWLEPYRQAGGTWKGNKIYEQLERKHPQHTFQSWRARYLSIAEKCTNMTITEHIDPCNISDNEDVPGPQERSSKRRRLDESQPAPAQNPPSISPRRSPSVHSDRAPSVRNSPPRIQPSKPVIARQDTAGGHRPNGHTEEMTEPQTANPDEFTSILAHLEPSGSAARSRVDEIKEDKYGATRQMNMSLTDQVSHDSGDDPRLILSVDESSEHNFRRQADGVDEPRTTVSKLIAFTHEEAEELYGAVPDIQNVEPQNLDQSWETMVQERSHHTVAEWRHFYESTILPEYMRQHNLETTEDLDDYITDLLAEKQYRTLQKQEIKEEPVLEDIPVAANQISDDLGQGEEEMATTSSSHVLPRFGSREHTDANAENGVSVEFGEPLPVMTSQTILNAVEVRQNGNLIAQESNTLQPQPSQPSVTQSSFISPKKRLFGRTLDAAMVGSQLQEPKTTMDSTRVNELSFGTVSATSALTSLNSQSVSSSKRPPESGQRPPKSATTSQEEFVAHDAVNQEQGENNNLDTLADLHGTLSNAIVDALPTSPAKSPTVDLLWEETEHVDPVPSSPAPSDTGSEYMAFDTAPQRSQLWELEEDETHDELVNDKNEDESDDARPRKLQSPQHSSPRIRDRNSTASEPLATSSPSRSRSEQDDHVNEDLEVEAQAEAEGSPEFDIQATKNVRVVPRTETQILFEHSVPEIDEDTTIFNLPPPEGGWEQFSDVEDELEDIHASVEGVDLDLPEHSIASSSSETNEAAVEPFGAGDYRPNTTLTKEVFVIPDHESEITTSSGDIESPTPVETRDLQQHQQRRAVHPVSDGSERTTFSSRTASSQVRDHEEEMTESSSTSSDDHSAIESWFSHQPKLYNTLKPQIVERLASTALQATVLNLSAAAFTLRDMVTSYQRSEAIRQAQFQVDTRIKREYTDSTSRPKFKPKTRLTEEEARSFLPRDVLGVWTTEDDRSFLSQTIEGLEKVRRKHGAAAVRKRAKFLRVRYGEEAVNVSATPGSRFGSMRKHR